MKTDLQKQIEKLTAEDNHKTTTCEKLGKIEHLAYLSERKDKTTFIINAKCKDLEEAKKVLTAYKPTNKNTIIGTATDKYHKNLKTPFNVKIENPPVCNSAQNFHIELGYMSDKYDVTIELPIKYVEELLRIEERHITDSEYHYFIGCSYDKLRSMCVRCYKFKDVLNDEVINWYGGDQTLCKVSIIETIINKILTT